MLDVPTDLLDETELGVLLVRHLGLLMVEEVLLANVRLIEEPHQGSRGVGRDRPATTRLIDLSHTIRQGMVTYPGLPGPDFYPHLTREQSKDVYAPGTEFTIDRISMLGNTGTYLDSPFHRYAQGNDLAGLSLDSIANLPISLGRFAGSGNRGINALALAALNVGGRAVLLQTNWDRHFGTADYAGPAPFLTADGARYLVSEGASLVGIDSVNIDDTASGGERPAHSLLLAAGIPVLEHLTRLGDLPTGGARLHAVPPKVAGFATFPVRAYAVVS